MQACFKVLDLRLPDALTTHYTGAFASIDTDSGETASLLELRNP